MLTSSQSPDQTPDPTPAQTPARNTDPTPRATPDWPVPPGTPVLLFGGSFDPPHRGHAQVALAARDAVFAPNARAAWLVLVPAARSPHKATGPVALDADRVRMLELAFAGAARVAVWTTELTRAESNPGEPSFWIDTLRTANRAAAHTAAARAGEQTPLRFLIGADQALAFHRWRSFRDILALASPAVPLRDPIATPDQLTHALRETGEWSESDLDRWASWTVHTPLIDASATAARTALRVGDEPAARRLLGDAVASYAIERGLYRSEGEPPADAH